LTQYGRKAIPLENERGILKYNYIKRDLIRNHECLPAPTPANDSPTFITLIILIMLRLSLIVYILAALSRFPLAATHPFSSAVVERANTSACRDIRNRVKAAFEADPGGKIILNIM